MQYFYYYAANIENCGMQTADFTKNCGMQTAVFIKNCGM